MRFLVLACLVAAASPAAADDYITFKSPSGNIACLMSSGSWNGTRCDIMSVDNVSYGRPADCDLDWGQAFEVGASDGGYPLCYGDTVFDPSAPVLEYGGSVEYGGVTCFSERTGMTCRNQQGHGFTLARAGQTAF